MLNAQQKLSTPHREAPLQSSLHRTAKPSPQVSSSPMVGFTFI